MLLADSADKPVHYEVADVAWEKKPPRISVIVPVYNEIAGIGAIQEHLRPLLQDAEVLFVDGGSTDGTQQAIDEGFTLISSGKGRARQMNAGAAVAVGDILLFLHADSYLPDDSLCMVRRVMAERDWGCFGIRFDRKTPWMIVCGWLSNRRARRGIAFGDQGIFISRELFESVGGFPEIEIMEDYQLSMTLRDSGYYPGMTPKRIVTSARRYPWGIVGAYRVMFQMAMLRKDYRAGVDPAILSARYKDIR